MPPLPLRGREALCMVPAVGGPPAANLYGYAAEWADLGMAI